MPHLELLVVSGDGLRELDLLPLADERLQQGLLVQPDVIGVKVPVERVRAALFPLEEDVCGNGGSLEAAHRLLLSDMT